MRVVIDRFEGEYAVCEQEDGSILQIEKQKIPREAGEGSVLFINGDKIVLDKKETLKKKKEMNKWMENLWRE